MVDQSSRTYENQEDDRKIGGTDFESTRKAEVLLRSELLMGSEMVPDSRSPAFSKIKYAFRKLWIFFLVLGAIFLGYYIINGPGSAIVEGFLRKLAESRSEAFQLVSFFEKTREENVTSTQEEITATLSAPTLTLTPAPTLAATVILVVKTEELETTSTPTMQAEEACIHAMNVGLDDVGKVMCVRGNVLRIAHQTNAFLVYLEDPVNAFFFLSYDRVWDNLKIGQCVQATGEVQRLGNNPVMIVNYKVELEDCP